MTRTLLALLLVFVQLPLAAATRRRAVEHRPPVTVPAGVVTAAHQAAEAALKAGVPAVQIAVSRRGQIVYSEAFGVTDKESATAATPRSVQLVASITKQFTAAAILRLAERGALTLDDRIEKFLPELDTKGATITLRHLLTHTSGITAPPPNPQSQLTREQLITFLNGQPLAFTPGTDWSYSNFGYMLLGHVIESVTGSSFADFIHSELALPLGLLDTGVCGTNNLPVPDGYSFVQGTCIRKPAPNMSVPFAAGALCSTASDLARWSYLLANGRVLLPASYATMTTPTRLANDTVVGYGLGLYLPLSVVGHPAVYHDGLIAGFNSFLVYFPADDISVAVISNAFPLPMDTQSSLLIGLAVAKAALAAP
ncbi:MAG TPA: serine hydrolase domain-containing protein [Thermoanaerobaculia bacterium]|nr:serine hydrolase domain-containing protein [Thermoanaerobaculia bacterium]